MKAIDSIRHKITKVSRSTVLFWVGCLVAVLTAVLPLIIPGAQLVLSLLGIGGVVLAGSQEVIGEREQDRKFEQERKRNDEAAQEYAIRHLELRSTSNLNKAPDSMQASHQQTPR